MKGDEFIKYVEQIKEKFPDDENNNLSHMLNEITTDYEENSRINLLKNLTCWVKFPEMKPLW